MKNRFSWKNDLVAERHQIVRDIETKLGRLEVINSLLARETEAQSAAQPSDTRQAVLAAVADGNESVSDIAAYAGKQTGAPVSAATVRAHLKALRATRTVIHANARYYVADKLMQSDLVVRTNDAKRD